MVKDTDCVGFLQWALPRLELRWSGFRRVRRQVCKRLARRLRVLGLDDLSAYQAVLGQDPEEWRRLDQLCRISISRFYRDREVWRRLETELLPTLARQATARGIRRLRIWSAGCASGEEPYSMALMWLFGDFRLEPVPEIIAAAVMRRAVCGNCRRSAVLCLIRRQRGNV